MAKPRKFVIKTFILITVLTLFILCYHPSYAFSTQNQDTPRITVQPVNAKAAEDRKSVG